MEVEDCRSSFEEWVKFARIASPSQLDYGAATSPYRNDDVQALWLAWQAAWNARPKRESVGVPFLKDCADGVRGRYCIARIKDSQGTHEYWNKGNKWSSFGEIVLDLTGKES